MDLRIGEAVSIVFRTMPYIAYRTAVYGILGLAGILVLGAIALIGRIFGGAAAAFALIILFAAGGFGLRLLREYILYLLQAGHIAVITEIAEKGALPPGVSQTVWGRDRVLQSFREVSVLALTDQLVKGILRTLNRTLFDVMTVLPVPGMEGLARLVQQIVRFSLTYVDEAILAYTFRTGAGNAFAAARSALILYCQSWQAVLKHAVALTLLSHVFVILAAIVLWIPLGLAAVVFPATWGWTKFILFAAALLIAFSLKWILFDPIAYTSVLLAFLREAAIRTPDPVWEERLAGVSDAFRDLTSRAGAGLRQPAPGNAPPTPRS